MTWEERDRRYDRQTIRLGISWPMYALLNLIAFAVSPDRLLPIVVVTGGLIITMWFILWVREGYRLYP